MYIYIYIYIYIVVLNRETWCSFLLATLNLKKGYPQTLTIFIYTPKRSYDPLS